MSDEIKHSIKVSDRSATALSIISCGIAGICLRMTTIGCINTTKISFIRSNEAGRLADPCYRIPFRKILTSDGVKSFRIRIMLQLEQMLFQEISVRYCIVWAISEDIKGRHLLGQEAKENCIFKFLYNFVQCKTCHGSFAIQHTMHPVIRL
ncbi:hypothetical protein NPIL_634151 [Nephila pilipes]|uniref:Uncharacterized protein n=1 Tax=Nephila pilipes TaxID=299642 RepID=A0A8X6PXP9_NEPPI|nr:hypothetical protein NPIL_634151 [Nephila pilipes]